MNWSTVLLTIFAAKENALKQQSLVAIQDSLMRKYDALNKICDFNKFTLKVLMDIAKAKNEMSGANGKAAIDDEDTDSDFGDNLLLTHQNNRDSDNDEQMTSENDDSE